MNSTLGISIPTYKRPEQLLETVRSVIAEGREFEIPVFIADDSADATNTEVLELLTSEYPFIRVFHNAKNLGIDGNILHSVDLNSCRYAWLLGEDDRMVPGGIARVLSVIEKEDAPFIYANYSSVNADFSHMLKPLSLPLKSDTRMSSERFFRQYSWSAGFIGACVVRKTEWDKVDRSRYVGTWFAHVGTIMELCHGDDIPMIAEPLVLNRCGTTEVFSWTSALMDVLDGWRRLCEELEPIYGVSACAESLSSFRLAHGLGTIKFLAYARAGGALTPDVVRQQILPGMESAWFKAWARMISRLPVGWFRTIQRWRNRG
jgi:glycosyltransferase involved in cell wall biosynthesis